MLLEIRKEKHKYVLVNPPEKMGAHFFIDTENGKIIPGHKKVPQQQSVAYQVVSEMAKKYPDNDFLKLSLQLTQKNYAAGEALSNNNLLNEAWTEKYGI